MALLAAYMECGTRKTLGKWLTDEIFVEADILRLEFDTDGAAAYSVFMKQYKTGLAAYTGLKEV